MEPKADVLASRPVFVPTEPGEVSLVREVAVEFRWNPGMAPSQKQKNILALHTAAKARGLGPLLEISTKSFDQLGSSLSAFNLSFESRDWGLITVEAAFQGSKVFEAGGPHPDMYTMPGSDLKRDGRLHELGRLLGFEWEGTRWSVEPKTAFYDWIYIGALRHFPDIAAELLGYRSFSDIEFNPGKSINCQARSCALYMSLTRRDQVEHALRDWSSFISVVWGPETADTGSPIQHGTLFD